MRMQSTRGWWTILGCYLTIYFNHFRLVCGEKNLEGSINLEDIRQHLCCARHERIIDVGSGISGEMIQIDIGHCRKLCPRHVSDDPGDASKPAVEHLRCRRGTSPRKRRCTRYEGGSEDDMFCVLGRSNRRGSPYGRQLAHVLNPESCSWSLEDRYFRGKDLLDFRGDISYIRGWGGAGHRADTPNAKCSQDGHCRPKAAKLERISTLQGVRIIETIDACECSSESFCRRESYTHLVHSGTPHQITIDVGVCTGRCGKDLGCKPVRNNTVSVKGPNGDEVYPIIERCGCAGFCHRMDHMETVLDFSEVEIKEGTNTTDVKPVIRQINVGQCVGTCPGNKTETCLLRDKREPTRCLAGLYSKQHNCMPARFKVHEYRTRRGSKREIIQITQCVCV